MISPMKHKHLITFGLVMVVAWVVGTCLFIYFWPHLVIHCHFKRAIIDQGFGDGPVPLNTLYTEPKKAFFGDPLHHIAAAWKLEFDDGWGQSRHAPYGRLFGPLTKGHRRFCMCRTSPGAITACSSPTRLTLTSPMSAPAPPASKRATTLLLGRTGKDRRRAA